MTDHRTAPKWSKATTANKLGTSQTKITNNKETKQQIIEARMMEKLRNDKHPGM